MSRSFSKKSFRKTFTNGSVPFLKHLGNASKYLAICFTSFLVITPANCTAFIIQEWPTQFTEQSNRYFHKITIRLPSQQTKLYHKQSFNQNFYVHHNLDKNWWQTFSSSWKFYVKNVFRNEWGLSKTSLQHS